MADHICSADGCEARVLARGWCGKHYYRWKKYGDVSDDVLMRRPDRRCKIEKCDRKHFAKGYCHLHYNRIWREQTRERGRLHAAKWRANNPDKVVANKRKHRYGITADEFELLRNAQANSCAICGSSFDETEACVDHCHDTGRVRGLLCRGCNTGIGMFRDSAVALRAAAEYVART